MNVYEKCPVLENERFMLRFVSQKDVIDLLQVYSDKKSIPLFNSDNCIDNFNYTTIERMQQAIEFWNDEYKKKYYVRWSIIDKNIMSAIGTIELFNRKAEDFYNNCGLLRLDLRSDYEKEEIIKNILGIIIPEAEKMFGCSMTATKAIPEAKERIKALKAYGFSVSFEKIIGHNGQRYGDYWVI